MLDVKIVGGMVFDGTGAAGRIQDVGVAGDRIVEIGDLSRAESKLRLDARNKLVCPGFIDAHSHSDAYLLILPTADSKVFQGVTTEIVGNCGASAAPRVGEHRLPSDWRGREFPAEWRTMSEYRALLAGVRPAVNVVTLVGHGNLRAGVIGYANRHATQDEAARMARLLEQSMDEGARGLSSGLIYPPGMFAPPEELAALGKVVARYDGVYTSHIRSESKRLIEALDETVGVGRASGCRVEISHLKTSGRSNWHLIDRALDLIRAARDRGVRVAADRYPYTSSHTDLDSVFPAWAQEGGSDAELKRLKDPADRARMKDELQKARGSEYWKTVTIASTAHAENRRFQGTLLCRAAELLGMEPVDALLSILEKDELRTGAFFSGMCEENMNRILAEPYVMVGSDSSVRSPRGVLSGDFPHPRGYGTFPRFLRMALDGGIVPLPDAVRKMTSLPAEQFGLKDRGLLAKDRKADVVVIDPNRVADTATYSEPHQLAAGVECVLVNGVVTLAGGALTDKRAGAVL